MATPLRGLSEEDAEPLWLTLVPRMCAKERCRRTSTAGERIGPRRGRYAVTITSWNPTVKLETTPAPNRATGNGPPADGSEKQAYYGLVDENGETL
jgi:hypothetical protein